MTPVLSFYLFKLDKIFTGFVTFLRLSKEKNKQNDRERYEKNAAF